MSAPIMASPMPATGWWISISTKACMTGEERRRKGGVLFLPDVLDLRVHRGGEHHGDGNRTSGLGDGRNSGGEADLCGRLHHGRQLQTDGYQRDGDLHRG